MVRTGAEESKMPLESREEDLLEVEMIDDWCGLADRLWKMEEELMCELMRRLVNPVGWGLGDMVEPDISV